MDSNRPLAPCLIGRGTLTDQRDMLRALETLEHLTYTFSVDGTVVDEGRAQLVKLMADPESATMIVNGFFFLNVASFRYLDFERKAEGTWQFSLYGDGTVIEMIAIESDETATDTMRPHLLRDEDVPDLESLLLFDEDDEDD